MCSTGAEKRTTPQPKLARTADVARAVYVATSSRPAPSKSPSKKGSAAVKETQKGLGAGGLVWILL